jgi:hypothetical protein
MTFYAGQPYSQGDVSILPADATEMRVEAQASDLAGRVEDWTARAGSDDATVYFGITYQGILAGQIFLHGIDAGSGESQVGYDVFEPWRGKGIRAAALGLLQRYVAQETNLSRLLTASSDADALRSAAASDFQEVTPKATLDGTVLEWRVPRQS